MFFFFTDAMMEIFVTPLWQDLEACVSAFLRWAQEDFGVGLHSGIDEFQLFMETRVKLVGTHLSCCHFSRSPSESKCLMNLVLKSSNLLLRLISDDQSLWRNIPPNFFQMLVRTYAPRPRKQRRTSSMLLKDFNHMLHQW